MRRVVFYVRLLISVFLGLILGMTNLYVALKLGFTVGVAILTVFCWGGVDWLLRNGWSTWRSLTPRDYACAQSLSSAMSYGSGTVMATALAAFLMSASEFPATWILVVWLSSVCALGTLMALPLRDRMLNRYPFPSGTAAAETVVQVTQGKRIRSFFGWLGGSALIVLARDLWHWIPSLFSLGKVFALQPSPMLFGLGAILGFRICASMALGGVVFLVVIPHFAGSNADTEQRVVWFAVSAMLSSALLDFFLSHQGKIRGGATWQLSHMSKNTYWTLFLCFSLTVWLTSVIGLDASPWCVMALLLMPLFSLISCRVTGETDVVPTGALGKSALLLFGLLKLGHPQSQMVSTGILAGSSAASADFMTDLRCGKNLDCPVKPQFAYQFAGAVIGPIFFVPIMVTLVKNRFPLGDAVFPAPAAQIWLNVLDFTQMGWAGLQGPLGWILPSGLICGALLTLVARHPAFKKWFIVPVPFAFAAMLDVSTVLTLLVGACVAIRIPLERGFIVWCAMIAAESAMALILLSVV